MRHIRLDIFHWRYRHDEKSSCWRTAMSCLLAIIHAGRSVDAGHDARVTVFSRHHARWLQ